MIDPSLWHLFYGFLLKITIKQYTYRIVEVARNTGRGNATNRYRSALSDTIG